MSLFLLCYATVITVNKDFQLTAKKLQPKKFATGNKK